MYIHSAHLWHKPRLRRRGRRLFVKRAGFACVLLAGSVASRSVCADTINWTLLSDGLWNVAANWTASSPPTQRVPTLSDDAVNTTGYTITLSDTGYANTFTTNGNFNLTGTLNLNSALTIGSSNVMNIQGGKVFFQQDAIFSGSHLTFTGSSAVGVLAVVPNHTLTIASGTVINGSNGAIGNPPYPNTNGGNVVNNGTISSDVSGGTLTIGAGNGNGPYGNQFGTLINTGTLQALNGGTLYVNAGNGGMIGGTIQTSGNGSFLQLGGATTMPSAILAEGTTLSAGTGSQIRLIGSFDGQNHTVNLTDGTLFMNTCSLSNCTVNVSGTGVGLDLSDHHDDTLDNVSTNGSIVVTDNYVELYNNITAGNGLRINNGNLAFHTDSILSVGNNATFSGVYTSFLGTDVNKTLTLASGTVINGSNGVIGSVSYNNGTYYGGNLVNNGTISSDVSGGSLQVQAGYYNGSNGVYRYGTFTSTGTLEAKNGGRLDIVNSGGGTLGGTIQTSGSGSAIYLGGTETLANGTVFSAGAGSHLYLLGKYYNAGNAINLTDGLLTFSGGTLSNSTVTVSGTGVGLDFTASTGTLNSVRTSGSIAVGNGELSVLNSVGAGNGITIDTGIIHFITDSTLLAGTVVTFAGDNLGLMGADVGKTLTLASGTLIHGNNGVVGSDFYNNGFYGGNLVNNGTISSDVSGGYMQVQAGYGNGPNSDQYGTFTNTGTLQAQNGGTLDLINTTGGTLGGSILASGANSVVHLGGIETLADGTTFSADNGGKIYLTGAYDNQNHAINVTDGSLAFDGGMLSNSTVNVSGTGVGLDFTGNAGTLNNVSTNGSIAVGNGSVTVLNNLSAGNGISIAGGSIRFNTDGLLSAGNGVTFSGNAVGYLGAVANQTLTLASGTVVNGSNGVIGSVTYDSVNNRYIGGSLVNNGTISADVNGTALTVQTGSNNGAGSNQYGTFSNTGTLQAVNGATLNVNTSGGSVTSSGNIRVSAGSNIFTGNMTQTAGSTVVNGTLTANIFTVQGGTLVGSGTVSGNVQNQGGTLSAGSTTNTTGTLSVTGSYTQDSSSVFLVKLGGATQGVDYDLLNVNGTATLAGQLQVQLLNNFTPTVGETFDILTYQNRTGAFDSIFASNGDTYSVTYNDTSGIATLHFNVAAVPETGTLASLGVLASAGVFSLRRKTQQAKKAQTSPSSTA